MSNALDILLTHLGVAHTEAFVSKLYNEHPNRDNLLGIKQMVSVYGIEAEGVKCANRQFDNLTFPCVLHTHDELVIALSLENQTLTYVSKGVKHREPAAEFAERWTGLFLRFTVGAQKTPEPDYGRNRLLQWISRGTRLLVGFSLAGVVVGGVVAHRLWTDAFSLVWLLLALLGCGVCFLLLQTQQNESNQLTDKLCQTIRNFSCRGVLSTRAAKLFGVISWSEVGMAFFAAQTLLTAVCPSARPALLCAVLCAMPYGLWSVWYQWRRVGKWCVLCLATQVLVWLMGLLGLAEMCAADSFPALCASEVWIGLVGFGWAFATVLVVLHYVALHAQTRKDLAAVRQKRNALMADNSIFHLLLQNGRHCPADDTDSRILFGQSEAPLRVTAVVSPHCGPCAQMHERLQRLSPAVKKGSVCVQYIFTSLGQEQMKDSQFLIATYFQKGRDEASRVFSEWYAGGKDRPAKFIARYDIDWDDPRIAEETQRHKRWTDSNKVDAVPLVLVNGRVLSQEVCDVEDLLLLS